MDSAVPNELAGVPNELILSSIRHIYRDLKKAVNGLFCQIGG